ncbi:hypothetical protein CFP56_006900 [Quercus suber]|uniref:DUF4220 domain-containing protein n=1 Tax=Quercus suber TaxID=58331 RepID=A0AAW0M9G0_QUESU
MELLQTKFAPIRKHCAKLITSNQRWSNSIGQLNLLSFALKDKSDQVGRGTPKLSANLREWVFNQILSKLDGELEMLLYSNHKQTQRLVQVFPEPVQKVWNNWELRVLALVSLTLQLFLLHLDSRRRYSVKTRFKIILWFFYLSADSVATVALGVISNNQGNSCNCKGSQLQNELTAFWAPFLLLHLGGQDTITAYAVQDNELWSRNLLGLVVQSVMALYIFLLSWKVNWLSLLTILMLLAGFIKYAERIWVMRLANCGPSTPSARKPVAEPTIEEEALGLFKYFIKVIHARELSGHFDSTFHGWKVIEVELGYAYDAYYTKAPLFFTAWGFIFRFLSFTSIFFCVCAFPFKRKAESPTDRCDYYLLRYNLSFYFVPLIGLGQNMKG